MKTLKDFDFKNKRVLVRCDFNVPLDQKGNVRDDFRIKQAIPTIEYLNMKGTEIILMSHLGRPKGKAVESLKLTPVLKELKKYIDVVMEPASVEKGQILLLENLRFNKGEEKNDPQFSKKLANMGDIYINDAFSVSHRAHASIVGITKFLPSGAGLMLEGEIKALSRIMENPERPLVVIIGGNKIEDKAGVIEQFKKRADYILIGGKIAEHVQKSDKIYLPVESQPAFDIGEETIELFSKIIKKAKTILWVGPMGRFEDSLFEKGTREIAREIIKNKDAYKVVGGGDTVFAVSKFGLRDKFDYISMGGGAALDFLSNKELPGLKALN